MTKYRYSPEHRRQRWKQPTPEQRRRWNHNRNAANRERYADNPAYREKAIAAARAYFKRRYANDTAFRESEKDRRYYNKYGIRLRDAWQMLESQNFECGLCREDLFEPENVDHDHITGKVRSILCNRCNVMIGLAHEDVRILTRAIDYLVKHL